MSKAQNIVTSVKVEIAAPASVVWGVLVDLPRYGEWNPFTVRAESTLKLGEPVHLYIPDPANPGSEIHVLEHLIAYEPYQLLAWEQRPTATSKDAARRDQYIEAIDESHCTYYTTDIFLGVTADAVMQAFGGWVKHGFDSVARGVKAQAEKVYRAGR